MSAELDICHLSAFVELLECGMSIGRHLWEELVTYVTIVLGNSPPQPMIGLGTHGVFKRCIVFWDIEML